MKTDVQIAQEATLKDVKEIGKELGVDPDNLIQYGNHMAKIDLKEIDRHEDKPEGKLVLVTAINPTPAGEGKTTVNIGLSMGLNKIGKKTITTLREPSLGPAFGIKGGAAGGGHSQVVPMENINLHFTGDFHAITSAHNLISALLDNHIHQGNELGIDPRAISWKRVVDMNDRALRNVVVGLGNRADGVPRQDGFDITVASEIMAIFCLATDLEDLKRRIGDILIAYTYDKKPVYARDIKADGAVALLMKDAINPNLVQTIENTPAIIHGGPFANIAHGCNSVTALKLAMKLGEYTVTEAGFGADLGAEKFFNIAARYAEVEPDAVVLVATIKALKMHGGVALKDLAEENLEALRIGAANLEKHIENVRKFGVEPVVSINEFPTDTIAEIELLQEICREYGVEAVPTSVWANGGEGAVELARKVVEIVEKDDSDFKFLYDLDMSIEDKIHSVVTEIYGGSSVNYTPRAKRQLKEIAELGLENLPVCMAKTQYSLSDNPSLLGRPEGFEVTIRELRVSRGAGFIVALTGDVMTMPGLPKVPAADNMDVKEDGTVVGLF